jgi:type II secretory pathway pseudopilin PulG
MRSRLRWLEDRGETLLELVISITILGVCVVAIGTGIALSIKTSAIHRAQATASAFLHNYAAALQNSYRPCIGGNPPDYVSIAGLAAPSAEFSAPTATVRFWDPNANPAAFSRTTCPATDPGLQEVTLTLDTTGGLVSESVVVILRSQT